jgi:hypothetical protein
MMRIVIDSLVAVMLAGVLASVIMFNREDGVEEHLVEQTREAVREVRQQLTLQVALEKTDLNDYGWPRTIDPDWFTSGLPKNTLLDENARPWLEVAGIGDRDRDHPANIVASSKTLAAFWYNPYNGVVRARVPEGTTDETSLRLYNSVNASLITSVVPEWDSR